MPNWCENKIEVHGKKENIVDFIKKMKGKRAVYWNEHENKYDDYNTDKEVLTYNALLPVPEETLEIGYDAGYLKTRIKNLAIELGIEVPQNFGFAMEFLGIKEDVSWIKKADSNKEIPPDKYDDSKIVELLLLSEKLSILDGYSWQICNWGTKWDLPFELEINEHDIVESENGDSLLEIDLLTANAPPAEFFTNIAPKFPNLKFKISYGEEGNDFSGIVEIEKGKVVSHLQGHYGEHYGVPYEDEDESDDE